MLQGFGLMLALCAFACSLGIQGSTVPLFGEETPGYVSPWPSPSASPLNDLIPSPAQNEDVVPSVFPISSPWTPRHDTGLPPLVVQAPAPVASPSSGSQLNKQPHPLAPESVPPNYHQANAPASNAPLYAIAPETRASPILIPSPSIHKKRAAMPVAGLANQNAPHYAPASHSPTEAPSASDRLWHFNGAPTPQLLSKYTPRLQSPTKHHHAKRSGSPLTAPPIFPLYPSPYNHYHPFPATPVAPSGQARIPSASPKLFPSAPAPQNSKILPLPALPPPPPRTDCAPLACPEPLTNGPPESPCVCVLPMQVGLRLTVSLYTFFPLVSVLASEIAAGVFMKQSQVRIMGANSAGDNPEETIVLIYLLPLEERFDVTTACLTFKRFWSKQVVIQPSFFGDFDVLFVRYPGLPPSPPLPPSANGIIPSKPYLGHGNNGRTMKPLGVDISRKQHKHWPSRSMLSMIILSCLVALLLVCGGLWVLIFRHRHYVSQLNPNPPTMIHDVAKSSGKPASMIRSGNDSPSFSFGSSIEAYTGSAKTFSSRDIEKATEFFNEARILGEGGFGRVFNGVLDDGTKVAIKILKRYDQQGGREFLAEVEMLSRLHHRNLVKLIGICIEERTRCLVYELVPNGSVESHLHGFDKERSPLDWSARLKIALGAARALTYLHEDSTPRVIHRDFKASNILLENDFTPKVSDFGLARAAFDEANRHISTRVMGTFGYVAPEYAMTGHLLVKSDVYSYGVVLLELLTGKKPVDMSQPPGQESLVSWARPLLTSQKDLESIIDPSLGPDFPFDSIAKVAAIASMCVQPEVSNRPFMGEVVQALKLVCNEHDETKDLASRSCCSQEVMSIVMDDRDSISSDRLAAALLTPCSAPCCDYQGLSMSSELLNYAARFDCESFRRHSSSGPLRTGKAKKFWKTMRRMSSEHGLPKFLHGSN